ncbi:MAG TPA: rhomboid family intramembrane serine protease [Terriglobales bacterium]|nr:rhomboid family intramembrane serine protease [Terriglobales bacterium]
MAYRTYGGGGSRYYGTGGARGGGGGGGITLNFPPFYGAVKMLILINVAVYFGLLLIGLVAPTFEAAISDIGALVPRMVLHGAVWQVVTYAFLHGGLWHILGNMLQLWFFGSTIEGSWGKKQFYEFYFFCVIGAAITTIVVSYTGMFGVMPSTPTIGASGGVFGVLVAFAILFGDQQVYLFPFPVSLKAKYLVAILILINLAGALGAMRGARGELVAYAAHIGGALFGWMYLKFLPRKGLGFATSESYYGLRNSYYKWKRRRAAKKFEVYMRKHDRADYFDQYGNFKAPEEPKDKDNGESRGGWVN